MAELRRERAALLAEVGEAKEFKAQTEARETEIAKLKEQMAQIDKANSINEVRKVRGNV